MIGGQVCEAKFSDRPHIASELDYVFKCPNNNLYVGIVSPSFGPNGFNESNVTAVLKEGTIKKVSSAIAKPVLITITQKYAVFWGDDY